MDKDYMNEARRTKAMEMIAKQLKIKNQIEILNTIIKYSKTYSFAEFSAEEIENQIIEILKKL